MVVVRVERSERMKRLLLLIVVITSLMSKHLAAATTDNDTLKHDILNDITNTICTANFFKQAWLYLGFCADDGFDRCSKYHRLYMHVYVSSM